MVIESAEDRVLRVLALSVGVGGVIFTLLGFSDIVTQSPYLDDIYRALLDAVFFGLPIVLAVTSFTAPVNIIRGIAAAHAASALLFLAFWDSAVAPGGIPGHPEPFLLNIISVATCTAAIVLPYVPAWAYLVLVAVVSGVVRGFGYVDTTPDYARAFQDALFIALFSAVMTTLIQLARAAGRGQDHATEETRESAAATKAVEALDRQRTRYHAFTHDDVLATLNSAVHNSPDALLAVQESARHALEKMDEFRADSMAPAFHTAPEVEALIRGAAVSAGAELGEISVENAVADGWRIPVEVSDAIAEALAEAIRNSIRHAGWPDGRPVHREIAVDFTRGGLRIIVRDDGVGFAFRRIAPDRLGVRISILQRVNSQPGGEATISSARGRGTTVTISWTEEVDA